MNRNPWSDRVSDNFNPHLVKERMLTILNVLLRLKLSPALYSVCSGAYASKIFRFSVRHYSTLCQVWVLKKKAI